RTPIRTWTAGRMGSGITTTATRPASEGDLRGRVPPVDPPAPHQRSRIAPARPHRTGGSAVPICPRAGRVARVVIPLLLAWRAAPAQSLWRLSDPVVEIGRGESAGFGNVAGAVRHANGGIIATDGQVLELRYFDASGRLVARAGRRGDGPGEFRSIRALLRCGGDSAFVYDPILLRVSVFAPSGR